MSLMKSLMKQNWFHGILCWLIAKYLHFVYATTKWDIRNFELLHEMQKQGAVIPVTWHNRIAMTIFAWNLKTIPLTVLASGHRDGLLVTRSLAHFGIRGVSIPPKSSGAGAVRQVVKLLKSGQSVVITPDGPRGPRQHMKDGVVAISRLSKAPIIMVTFSCKRRKIINSWDKFILPLPFGRGILAYGKAPQLTENADAKMMENYRALLEAELSKFSDGIDLELGLEPIKAASAAEISKAKKREGK